MWLSCIIPFENFAGDIKGPDMDFNRRELLKSAFYMAIGTCSAFISLQFMAFSHFLARHLGIWAFFLHEFIHEGLNE